MKLVICALVFFNYWLFFECKLNVSRKNISLLATAVAHISSDKVFLSEDETTTYLITNDIQSLASKDFKNDLLTQYFSSFKGTFRQETSTNLNNLTNSRRR